MARGTSVINPSETLGPRAHLASNRADTPPAAARCEECERENTKIGPTEFKWGYQTAAKDHHALLAQRTKERDEAREALRKVLHDVEMFDLGFSEKVWVDHEMGPYHGRGVKERIAEARRVLGKEG